MRRQRFPRRLAMTVAREICEALRPVCSRIAVAGSLRRGKREVGDVEILYVPLTEERDDPQDMFARIAVNLADERIAELEAEGLLRRRKNVIGSEVYGPKNKLMQHCGTGIPVDLFSTTEESWWNYLVCRTGPAESNQQIATLAKQRGWKWNPYGEGFSRGDEVVRMESEEAVFEFVGLRCPR